MEPITGFIAPEPTPGLPVLARFLAPLPANIAAAYIAAYSQADELVVNPFCRTPVIALESERLGRRALLADANPLTAFVVRQALCIPAAKDLNTGFTRLAETPKGETPLRNHLRQLYQTTCPRCGQSVIASHFVWSRQLDRPTQKCYHCPTCQQARTEPVNEADLAVTGGFEARGFHYWAIVERLAPPDEESRALVQRLLALYTPRNLYALATLVNKAEAVLDPPGLLDAFRFILL
ncbi:MAG: hypothetical protein Q7U96_00325, partial [Chloroflexota bacterium]|nr:hypothetical protein [Chloroflexota bacterium]